MAFKRWLTSEVGQDIVEYALTLPLLLLLVLSIIEGSLLILAYDTVANAAREGARTGVIPASTSCNLSCIDAKVDTAARTLTTGLDNSALTVAVDRSSAGMIQVDVTYDAPLITGLFVETFGGSGTVTLHTVATMRLE